jgi:hypothetical protein
LAADGYVVRIRVTLKAAAANNESIKQRDKRRHVGDSYRRRGGLWDHHGGGLARAYGDPSEQWAVSRRHGELRAAGDVSANYFTVSDIDWNAWDQTAGGIQHR